MFSTHLCSHCVCSPRDLLLQRAGAHASRADKPACFGHRSRDVRQDDRPQDDTFIHTNGVWLAKTDIPADKSSYGAFDMLFDKSQADLRAIVEDAAKRANKPAGSDAQKIGDFYESFMDEARADALGLTPVQAELATIDALDDKGRSRPLLRANVQAQSNQPTHRLRGRRRTAT